jgi:23S rRNA (guanosine2251-2'-O)-methyltransferase
VEIVLVLDNIRSLYNVGSMFRTADGFGVRKIFLCGITGTPEQNGLKKVALGAELAVPWEKSAHAWRTVERLKKEGYAIVGLERCDGAAPIGAYRPLKKLALLVGNEVEGISPAMRRRLDAVLEIPMRGTKESFNVAVACGIALYALTHSRRRH